MFNHIKKYRTERARRKLEEPDKISNGRKKWKLWATVAAVFAMSFAVYFICFAYKSPVVPQVFSNKVAQVYLVSPFEFSYVSEYQTQSKRNQIAERIPPFYKIDADSIARAQDAIDTLVALLNERRNEFEESSPEEADEICESLSSQLKNVAKLTVNPEDIKVFFANTTAKNCKNIFSHVAFALKVVLRQGIYADGDKIFSGEIKGETQPAGIQGISPTNTPQAASETTARAELLDKLKNMGVSEAMALAVYRTFVQEVNPNITFDEQKTKDLREKARNAIQPVVVKVREGETIIDASSTPTPIMQEKLRAYKSELAKRRDLGAQANAFRYIDYIVSLLLVSAAALFFVISKTPKNKKPRTVLIFSALLILNLAMERFIIHLSNAEYFDTNTTFLQIFAYGTPIMLGPIIQVLLFGSYTGFVMAILIAALTTMMIGESIVIFVLFLAAALVAIYFCDGAHSRSRVIFGGVIYGMFLAFFSFIISTANGVPISIAWRQALLAVIAGSLTGVFATVILPIVEKIFGRYSNIALIEYTDFNNPLLRRLQIEAPGTYHHSVMVSFLAEHAAVAVSANPMVCRIGALYHDIGKIIKPEFFSENQGGGKNPHDDQNPSMSALIIKNHIKEGVELARIAKMPPQVIDAIKQHHGTSIISYFYNKAVKLAKAQNVSDPLQALRDAGIDESTYRHEGVKPQTVENAIIMLADSCEAASRSLKRVTQHGITELVNAIVKSKIDDGQLDSCPITIKQISKIKQSFVFTMMNMLHTRVEYNNAKK